MAKTLIGKITHFFPKVGVAVVNLSGTMKVGDKISIEKDDEVMEQVVKSMQVEHKNIQIAKPGDDVGMKTDAPVKEGSLVYKL